MKILGNLFIILFLIGTSACNKQESTDENILVPITDQKIPGTNISATGEVRGVYNVRVCPNIEPDLGYTCPEETLADQGKVTLTWEIPSIYRTEEWFAVIYRSSAETDPELTLGLTKDSRSGRYYPNIGNAIFEVTRIKDTRWEDTTVVPTARYFYWVFLVIQGKKDEARSSDGFWAAADRRTTKVQGDAGSVTFPNATEFWKKVRWNNMVSEPAGTVSNPVYDRARIKPGMPSMGSPKGRIASANNGAILFASDTNNNRVLVFENSTALTCADDFEGDDLSYFACLMQAESQAPMPINILGQPNDSSTLSCVEHNTACNKFTSICQEINSTCAAQTDMTNCNSAAMAGSTASVCAWVNPGVCVAKESCSNETQCSETRDSTPSFCKWENNTCKVKGSDCLTKPTELLVTENNQLLISDSGNHRVVYFDKTRFSIIPQDGGDPIKYTIGCDGDIIINNPRPTKCSPDKLIGKPSGNDFSLYNVAIAGQSALNYPTGLAVDNGDLYIADTLNNRIVKVYDFANPNQYLCNEDTWLSSLCQFKGLLGQGDYLTNETLKDFFEADPNILGGTFSNEVQEALPSPLRSNNLPLWLGESENVLKRYFRNPTKIQIVERESKKHLLVLAHEDFNATTGIGTQVSLRNRILRFDNEPLSGASPKCNPGTFETASCLAAEVIGQETFRKIIILSGTAGGTGTYTGSVYALDNIDDMDMFGSARLVALSGASNEIYSWNDFLNKEANGFPYNIKISNPLGAIVNGSQSLANLKGISGIIYDEFNGKCYVLDSVGSKLYQLDFVNIITP